MLDIQIISKKGWNYTTKEREPNLQEEEFEYKKKMLVLNYKRNELVSYCKAKAFKCSGNKLALAERITLLDPKSNLFSTFKAPIIKVRDIGMICMERLFAEKLEKEIVNRMNTRTIRETNYFVFGWLPKFTHERIIKNFGNLYHRKSKGQLCYFNYCWDYEGENYLPPLINSDWFKREEVINNVKYRFKLFVVKFHYNTVREWLTYQIIFKCEKYHFIFNKYLEF